MISVAVRHRTTYRYGTPVLVGPQLVRLRPMPCTRATIRDYTLTVAPKPDGLRWFQDAPGNAVAQVLFRAPTDTLEFAVAFEAELPESNPFDFTLDPAAATWPFRYPAPLAHELVAYQSAGPIQSWLATLLTDVSLQAQPSVSLLVALNQVVFGRIRYTTRMEPGVLSPEQTMDQGSGSCRDVAWLLVNLARSLGLAARFVSGYLIQLVEPGSPQPGSSKSGPSADTVDLHAWAEIYLPGAGWIGLDATSGLITGATHIGLAGSAYPEGSAPISGTVGLSPTAHFDIETTVERVTLP